MEEVYSKSVLSESKLPGIDYSVNPYTGCTHGCVYCYARFMEKYIKQNKEWGSFVFAKVNAPQALRKELTAKKKGLIFFSSVCDPYQEAEMTYELTRKCLEEIRKKQWPVAILTKSDLVLRDMDVLKKIDVDVGFTITTANEEMRKKFEPDSSPTEKRIKALKALKESGIKTYVFLGPILPEITDWKNIIGQTAFVDRIMVDKLNIKSGNWPHIKKVLPPELFPEWSKILFQRSGYWKELREEIRKFCKERGIRVWFCF